MEGQGFCSVVFLERVRVVLSLSVLETQVRTLAR
jgi:hypothetical protein